MTNHRKNYAAAAKLTDSQKAEIRKEFREFSGGYHPGEAGEEHDRFLEEWEGVYGHDALDAFLTQWGEEELAKEAEESRKKEEQRRAGFKKSMQKLASSFVRLDASEKSAVLVMEDPSDPGKPLVFRMPDRKTKTEAKAEAADLMWAVQMLLEKGAEEWQKR